MIRLPIQATWDGAPVDPAHHLLLTLEPTPNALVFGVDAPFYDDPPPPTPPGPCWALWEYEVVELFILGADERYLEIELAPGGQHLVLQLDGRRQIVNHELPLAYTAEVRGGRWRGQAEIPRALLPAGPHRINGYAIHNVGDDRLYLAWQPVPGPSPDFHRLEYFAPVNLEHVDR